MTLDRRLFDEACDSAVTQRMIAEMVKTRIIHRIVGDDVEAGMEVYGHSPDGAHAAALAEAESMTEGELRALAGELPERAMEYNARAFTLLDEVLGVLGLPDEVVATISGDLIAVVRLRAARC